MACLTEWINSSISYLCCRSGVKRATSNEAPVVAQNGATNGSGNQTQNGIQYGIQNKVSAGTQIITENAAAVQSGDTGEASAAPTSSSSRELPDQKSNGEPEKPAQADTLTKKVKAPKPKATKRFRVMPVQVSLDIVEPAPSTEPPVQKRLLCFY
ncbi:hypothetical protein GCK72_026278 [Caenorhabditis remanei]|uniref:Uncharacterized protein n=1 Tax=Caenorhabditis remanei TaxID=31234 RepID=A0A6A5G5N5_CAERE|nr:hypothetical protein GCK72_026278 [Caenorhabditis remanei]KAF1749809.1 hypothetical protein GCK72_026278 [Caenorhabditis remanei]